VEKFYLCIKLISDASFSRGDGLTGEVDNEIQYDYLGCPFINARTIKGILVEECADILHAIPDHKRKFFEKGAKKLFGMPGEVMDHNQIFQFGNAYLPDDFRKLLKSDLEQKVSREVNSGSEVHSKVNRINRELQSSILHSITSIRTQTAIDDDGVAREHSLRAIRVVMRQTIFEAEILFSGTEEEKGETLPILAACVKSFRRAGSHRNRGLGKIDVSLEDSTLARVDITNEWFTRFEKEVKQ